MKARILKQWNRQLQVTNSLTKEIVKEMAKKGVTKAWVQKQLEAYKIALTKEGKLKN